MINKRLLNLVEDSKKYIIRNVMLQWLAMLLNVVLIGLLSQIIYKVYLKDIGSTVLVYSLLIIGLIIARSIIMKRVAIESYYASKQVKPTLRRKIYNKLLLLGPSYKEDLKTSEIVQVAVEGVEQLEIYFGSYLPQFFYSFLAPFTLFVFVSFASFKIGLVLLISVFLIPLSIMIVSKIAKKLLSKYWGRYASLGDSFLENLQGLTMLKIYEADDYKHQKMNEEAEEFRKVTMKVLTMQLNSITIMDLVTFLGSAIGIILAVLEYRAGNLTFTQTFWIILLSAEFFIPMRLLGSFFHIAMNGISASEKIFRLLDLEVSDEYTEDIEDIDIQFNNVSFAYEEKEVLKDISLSLDQNGLYSIVGESGSGKSTIAKLLVHMIKGYNGDILIGNKPLNKIKNESLLENITLISHNSYIFKGTVRENLMMGFSKYSKAKDDQIMLDALEKTKLRDFIDLQGGLDMKLDEGGSNLSGGQRQRLIIARSLVANSRVFIFDEVTSNIDVESEKVIVELIKEISKDRIIIMISHHLYNVIASDKIYVLKDGIMVEEGTHSSLMDAKKEYFRYYTNQEQLIKGDQL